MKIRILEAAKQSYINDELIGTVQTITGEDDTHYLFDAAIRLDKQVYHWNVRKEHAEIVEED